MMFWPPTVRGLLDKRVKRISKAGEWACYTAAEFEEGDYCVGDEQVLKAGQQTSVSDLTA